MLLPSPSPPLSPPPPIPFPPHPCAAQPVSPPGSARGQRREGGPRIPRPAGSCGRGSGTAPPPQVGLGPAWPVPVFSSRATPAIRAPPGRSASRVQRWERSQWEGSGDGGRGVQGSEPPFLCPQGMRGLEGTTGLPGPPGPRVGTASPRAPNPAHPHSPRFFAAELSKATHEVAWEVPLSWAGTFLGPTGHESVLGPRALQRPPGRRLSPAHRAAPCGAPVTPVPQLHSAAKCQGSLPAGEWTGGPPSLRSTFSPSLALPGVCAELGA